MNSSPIHESLVRAQLEPNLTPWKLAGAKIRQAFNEPDEILLRLMTDELTADASELLGRSITLTLTRGSCGQDFSGIVESIEDGVSDRQMLYATVTVVSALASLKYRTNSRIFQDMTIPEILKDVLQQGLARFGREVDTSVLAGTYDPVEFTVQFNESDFDFVHRLMEEHGINYHFDSSAGQEVMVLSDSGSVYADFVSAGFADGVLHFADEADLSGLREILVSFQRKFQRRSTVAKTVVFDWLAPDEVMKAEQDKKAPYDGIHGGALSAELEDYRYDEPAAALGYRSKTTSASSVDLAVARRRSVHQRDVVLCSGHSTAVGLAPATRFELFEHPQMDLDGRYRVITVEHSYGVLSEAKADEHGYDNRFECIPAVFDWAPSRRRSHPRIFGVQTATVVGPPGEEIHTDVHGRIKVQFHWDREGQRNEHSTCFIRVVQPWAGNGWGVLALPRIGMEVAVTFVDGDPDRPIVTGALYNGTHKPPYPLPDERTKSTFKSQSTPGGGGFNEVRFDDAAGSEEIFVHAQRDYNEVVLNDHTTQVGNDQSQTIEGNQTENIDGHQNLTVRKNRTLHVVGDFQEDVEGSETRAVTGDVTETLSANETRQIRGNQTEAISGDFDKTVTGNVVRTVAGSVTDVITGTMTQTITGSVSITTPETYDVTATGGITMTAAGGITMIAPGGFTVLAPGGTTTVDSFFEKHGGISLDAFALKLAFYVVKTEIDALTLTIAASKVDIVGVKVDIAGYAYRNTPMSMETLGSHILTGLIHMNMYSMYMVF